MSSRPSGAPEPWFLSQGEAQRDEASVGNKPRPGTADPVPVLAWPAKQATHCLIKDTSRSPRHLNHFPVAVELRDSIEWMPLSPFPLIGPSQLAVRRHHSDDQRAILPQDARTFTQGSHWVVKEADGHNQQHAVEARIQVREAFAAPYHPPNAARHRQSEHRHRSLQAVHDP